MDPVPGERVQIGRQRRHQRLALAGAHLGDLAVVKREPADELHIEVPQAQFAARGLPHQGERLGDQVAERGAGGMPRLEFACLCRKLIVGHLGGGRFEPVDGRNRAAQLLDQALVTAAENLRQKLPHGGSP